MLGESGVEVLEDLLEAVHLGGVGPEERAADAGVFMLAGPPAEGCRSQTAGSDPSPDGQPPS